MIDFFFVESKPDEHGERRGIDELKRDRPRRRDPARNGTFRAEKLSGNMASLQVTGAAYLPLESVLAICRQHEMDDEVARLFVTISHRLGHLIHYQHDPRCVTSSCSSLIGSPPPQLRAG